ncbi:MAG: hypothetical protein ABEK17_04570 [Candidatus Aenigmatarchaeota archaeon]
MIKFYNKGVSTLGEFLLIIGVILVSVIFLLTYRQTITQQASKVEDMNVKEIGERVAGLMNRHKGGPSHVIHSIEVPRVTVEVKDGVLTVERGEKVFSESITKNAEDVFLNNTYKVVVEKDGDKIVLHKKSPVCNFNFICEPEECFSDCEDCYGPSAVCVGDGNCTKSIGETCQNSPEDCICDNGKECCPTHPDSDENSCLNITEKKDEGSQCYCNNQCSGNSMCEPTSPDFEEFEMACCPPGKGWNGEECADICLKGEYDRFACTLIKTTYNRYLDVCHPTVQSKIDQWILSDSDLRDQVYNDKFDNAVRKIWKKSFNNLARNNYCGEPCTGNRKSVNKLIDGTVPCAVCNHWSAVGTSLLRTLGVPADRVYSLGFLDVRRGHAVTGYKSDNGEWWILDYTCCERMVKAKNWGSCGHCKCISGFLLDNDRYSGEWTSSRVGNIC